MAATADDSGMAGRIVIAIDADSKGFEQGVQNINANLSEIEKKAEETQQALNATSDTDLRVAAEQVEEVNSALSQMAQRAATATETLNNQDRSQTWIRDLSEEIKGLDSDLSSLEKEAKKIDKTMRDAQKSGVDTAALEQLQYENLQDRIAGTAAKLRDLQEMERIANDEGSSDWTARRIAITETETALSNLKARFNELNGLYKQTSDEIAKYDSKLNDNKANLNEINNTIKKAQNSHLSYAEAMEINRQKAAALSNISEELKAKYSALASKAEEMKRALALGNITQSQYDEFQRTLIQTRSELSDLNKQAGEYGNTIKSSGEDTVTFGDILKANLTSEAIVEGAKKLVQAISDIVSGTKELVQEAMEAGDVIDKQSQILGLSRDAFQKWDYVLSLNGASISNMTTATRTLTNAVEKAESGTESAVTAFNKLGISLDDLNKLNREELFEKVVFGLQNMSDEQERNAIANDLLGRSYTQLIPLLNQTSESTQELLNAAHENGIIMSDEAVNAAVKYKDALTTLDYSLNGLKENLLAEIMPVLSDELIPVAQEFLNTLNDNLPALQATVKEFAEELSPKLQELGEKLGEFAVNEGLPAILDAFEWISNNGDELIRIVEVLAAAWAADKLIEFGEHLGKVPELAAGSVTALTNISTTLNSKVSTAFTNLSTILNTKVSTAFNNFGTTATTAIHNFANALTGMETTALASFAAITAAAAALVASMIKISDELNTIRAGLLSVTAENQKSTDNIIALNESWANVDSKSGIDRYREASALLDDVIAKEEDWSVRYKKTVDELNAINDKGYMTADDVARQKELQAQKESLDAEYATLQTFHVKAQKEIDKYDAETIRKMEEAGHQRQNIIENQGRTNTDAVGAVWENIRTATNEKMAQLDNDLATHKITEDEYWAQRKEYLEKHRDEENAEWWKLYDEVTEHYEKLSETERKAAEKAAKDKADADKKQADNAIKNRESNVKKSIAQIERTAQEQGLGSDWERDRFKELADSLEYGSDLYFDVYDKYLDKRDEYAQEESRLAEEARKEAEKQAEENKKQAQNLLKTEVDDIKSNLDDLINTYENGYNEIIKSRDDYKKKLMGGSVFSVATEKDAETGEEITTYTIDNLKKRLKAQREYADQINALRKRGLADGLLTELEGLDAEQAMVFARQLNKMSDEEFKELNESYNQLDEATTKAAAERYQGEIDSLQTEFIDKAEELFNGLSPELEAAGINSLQSFIAGFDMNKENAFKELEDFTDDVVSKINSGIADGTVDLSQTIESIVGDANIGDTLCDNLLNSIIDNHDELAAAIQAIFDSTGLDMQIKASMESSAAAISAMGYNAAEIIYVNQNQSGGAVKTSPHERPVTQPSNQPVYLLLNNDGTRIIAQAVNDVNRRNALEGGT